MMEAQAIGPVTRGSRTAKLTAFLFGAVTYFTFLFTILYAIGFASGFAVPRTIDTDVKSGHSRQLSSFPWRKFT
jgi:methanethiol S-methyltransferase